MGLILRAYAGDRFYDIPVEEGREYTIGNSQKANIQFLDVLSKWFLTVSISSSGWMIHCDAKLGQSRIQVPKDERQFGSVLPVDMENKVAVSVFRRSDDGATLLDLTGRDKVTVGRSNSCDITIASTLVSGKHIELTKQGERWYFKDLRSSNGSFLNRKLTSAGTLKEGDVLSVGLCQMSLTADQLSILADVAVKANFEHRQEHSERRCVVSEEDPYPFYYEQSPRLRTDLPEEEIDIDLPPAVGRKPTINWLNVLLMPILSMGVLFTICYFIAGTMQMLYYSAPLALIGAIMTIVRYKSEKKNHRRREQLRRTKYTEYLALQAKRMEELVEEQRRILLTENPSPQCCCRMAKTIDRTLWNRRPVDSDFMTLRIGLGEIRNRVSFKLPKQAFRLDEDELAGQSVAMESKYEMIQGCPVLVDLGKNKSCGIIGKRDLAITLGKNIITHAAAHHCSEDVRIVVFCDHKERVEWEFCKWLPHVFNENRSMRYISDTPSQDAILLEQFNSIFLSDEERGNTPGSSDAPSYLFICASSDMTVNRSVSQFLSMPQSSLRVAAVFLAHDLSGLPKECHDIIEVGATCVLYEREKASERHSFTLDTMEASEYEKFARSLAPLREEPRQADQRLPQTVTFLQGYNTMTPAGLNLEGNWSAAYPEQGMAVPIGIKSDGRPFFFDIHESHCGPHGLVAGMTGSGKSEMIQSWILSMAVRFPPSAVSFVLVDFKGTGLLLPFKRLPHLAGMISDLDTSIGRNLIALENELRRRKELLDKYNVSNIAAYLKLLHSGLAEQPLPYLFIVIDEFAEFKARFPDFMQVVDSIFAIGRTLGVHMILLTQKPANVVDDKMNANVRFRWCLKVASSSDSRDMIHRPDAAKIVNPGRAFVQVGENEVFEEIQSFWSGAQYNPYQDPSKRRADKVAVVDLYGNRTSYEYEKTTGYRADRSEIEAVVEFLDEYAQKQEVPRATAIWTSKLPESLKLRDIMQFGFDGVKWNQVNDSLQLAIGLVDDPRSQSQYPFYLNLREVGSTAVYGAPGTGKTTLLHTAIVSLAMMYSPSYVNMYLMDFGSGSLNLFRQLPHVGEVVVNGQSDEAAIKLSNILLDELNRRKAAMAQVGLTSIDAYRSSTGDPLPYIILLVDNFAPVVQLYPELDGFFQTITRDGAGCGIYVLATANAQTAIGYRISQNISYSIVLQMSDAGDYAALVGRTGGLVPENFPGRGLLKGKPPLEFQTALPADGETEMERVSAIRSLAALMERAWTGAAVPGIPSVPEVVQAANFPGTAVVLGVSCEDGEACVLDTEKSSALLVSTIDHTGAVFHAICRQVVERMNCSTIFCYGEGPDELGRRISGAEFDQAISALMPVLQERKTARKNGPLSDEDNPFIIIAIEDLKSCFDGIDNGTVPLLRNIVSMGKGLNILLLVNGDAAEIAKLYYGGDMFTISLVKNAPAILIGGSAGRHNAFSTNLSPAEASTSLMDTDGYLLQMGQAMKIKVVQQ